MRTVWILLLVLEVIIATSSVSEHLELELAADHYETVELEEGLQEIRMDGFAALVAPGRPMLPARVLMIALPPGAEDISVSANGAEPIELEGEFRIKPAPPPLPLSGSHEWGEKSLKEWRENYATTYSSDSPYPEEPLLYLGRGGLRKYRFVRVAFFPCAYRPKSGRLLIYPRCKVKIEYSLSQRPEVYKLLGDTAADERASHLFMNYVQANQWYAPIEKKSQKETYDYVIITTEALQDSVSPIVSWKESIGHGVNVVSTAWIMGHYSGVDLQERIRNFLIDKYIEWGIVYVLLVGNINDMPMRYCFSDSTDHDPGSDFCTPTDYYYADLTGDWDSDGDGYYGEYGQDDVDFVPEVYVGRIPWNTGVTGICEKICTFEQDLGEWKNRALLLGDMWYYANEDHSGWPRNDAADMMEEIIQDIVGGWSYTTMYEKGGLSPCPHSCDLPLTHENVVNEWSEGQYCVVNWGCHGNMTGAWRKVWSWDDGDNVPEGGEIDWYPFCQNPDAQFLDDAHPSIVFCCCCHNAWPEGNNLGRQLIKQGAVGVVASTRSPWGPYEWLEESHGGAQSIDYYFLHYLVNEGERIGEALYDSDVYYLNNFFWWGHISQHNMYIFNLYGDPAMVREGVAQGPLVSMHDYEWIDSGGDGVANPCDTLSLTVWLANVGEDASIVDAQVSTEDTFLVLIDSSSSFGEILSDSIRENHGDPFILWIKPPSPAHVCTLNLSVRADGVDFLDTIDIVIEQFFICGDCNGDDRVTIADATYLVAFIYRGGSSPLGESDVNLDERVTIADATYLVAYVYRSGPPPCEPGEGDSAGRHEQAIER